MNLTHHYKHQGGGDVEDTPKAPVLDQSDEIKIGLKQ